MSVFTVRAATCAKMAVRAPRSTGASRTSVSLYRASAVGHSKSAHPTRSFLCKSSEQVDDVITAPMAAEGAPAAPAAAEEALAELNLDSTARDAEEEVPQAGAPASCVIEQAVTPMNIVFVASECAPWSKTGGLGDVMGSLPTALVQRGHRVMVVVPRYGEYEGAEDTGVKKYIDMWGGSHEVGFFHLYENGVDYMFVDHPPSFMRMGTPYGDANGEFGDNQFRFSLLTAAALEAPLAVPLGGFPYGDDCVFVANDWHTALLPVFLAAKYRPYGVYLGARSLLCIHNLFHQGCFPPDSFGNLNLDGYWYDAMGWQYQERAHMKCYSYGHAINYMKGAITCADRILTVSPGYAHEITTPEGGNLMDPLLGGRSFVLNGIVNGVGDNDWNPAVDIHLTTDGFVNYSIDTLEEGKAECKLALQRIFGLPERADVPVLGFIGRLDDQKGADIILESLPWLCQQDVQVIMLGSGKSDLEDGFRWAESEFNDKVRAYVGFNVPVSHRITAGIDIFMMPSRFEPCGLNQLYSMKYGTPVVAHATGGLRDTVIDYNYCKSVESEEATGWTFDNADVGGLIYGLECALDTYRNAPEEFRKLQLKGMERDSSWDSAARQYETVFQWAKQDPPVTC